MTTNIINSVPFLRTTRNFPAEINQLVVQCNKSYVDIANYVNQRVIGLFPNRVSAVTGESWYLSQNQRQQTIRQVYTFGAIAAGTELDIPVGNINFTQFTRIYGTVITNAPDYRPLPYLDPINLTTGMTLLVGTVAIAGVPTLCIRIVLGATAQPVTSGIVVLEWLSPV